MTRWIVDAVVGEQERMRHARLRGKREEKHCQLPILTARRRICTGTAEKPGRRRRNPSVACGDREAARAARSQDGDGGSAPALLRFLAAAHVGQ